MWQRIQLQSNCVQTETSKAVLINMPRTSRYKGFSFWHPSKCCRLVGKNGYLVQISFTDTFEFRLKKYGKGQYNWNEVIDEKTLSPEELKDALGFGVSESTLEDLQDED